MFLKVGVLKNFANFTGKQLLWNFFLMKLRTTAEGVTKGNVAQQLYPKKRFQHRCFPMKFVRFLRTPLSTVYHG